METGFLSIPGSFTLRPAGYGFFQGASVLAVLNGALIDPNGSFNQGLPVSGTGLLAGDVFLTLKNNLLGGTTYSNYGVLTEVELAMFKDLGYDNDLKSQYGYSEYGSNIRMTNTTGFFARNAAGDGWLEGVYNRNAGAIGLHVHGAYNTIVQAADILSAGAGSAGIRIDGYDSFLAYNGYNTVTVAPGVKVHAHGADSNALLVAYSRNHVVINRGELAALGEGGVGARFDYGVNVLSGEYRGSYKRYDEDGNDLPYITDEGLDGALVDRFDVTGTVAGRKAAIYIGDTALVGQINIMNGAALYGDIISFWDRNDPHIQPPAGGLPVDSTTLSFGWLADADGVVTSTADSDFSLTYQGNILGREGMNVLLAGGTLSWQGRMDVIDYTQDAGTTLLGIIGDSASVIGADTIALAGGSSLGVTDVDFQYGRVMDLGVVPVLTFDSASFTNDATLLRGIGGSFAMGAYDYTYGEASWLDAETVGVELTGAASTPSAAGPRPRPPLWPSPSTTPPATLSSTGRRMSSATTGSPPNAGSTRNTAGPREPAVPVCGPRRATATASGTAARVMPSATRGWTSASTAG